MNAADALLAEHCLHETRSIARRIDLEISFQDMNGLLGIAQKTNLKIMEHLCLGVDVDTEWSDLPSTVREAILCRIVGRKAPLSQALRDWMTFSDVDMQTRDVLLDLTLVMHEKVRERQVLSNDYLGLDKVPAFEESRELRCHTVNTAPPAYTMVWRAVSYLASLPTVFTKWVGILSGAGSDVEREIWYSLRHIYGRSLVIFLALSFWRFCGAMKNMWVYILLIYHRKALVKISRLAKKGATRSLHKNIITVEMRRKTKTGFASRNCQGSLTLDIFDGQLQHKPTSGEPCSKAVYDDHFRLAMREDRFDNHVSTATYTYAEGSKERWPASKHVICPSESQWCFYDNYGRVTKGTLAIKGNVYEFQYSYKSSPKGSHEVLKAEFRLAQNSARGEDCLVVYWGVPLRPDVGKILDWVPSDRLCRVVRKIGNRTYTTTSNYQHRYDPVMITVLEDGNAKGTLMSQPPTLFDDEDRLKCRPTDVSFINDDLLIHHSHSELQRIQKYSYRSMPLLSLLNPAAWLYWRRKVVHQRVPTWWLRTELWNNWLKSGSLDGVTACWLDEIILREEPLLKNYWRARNMGRLSEAKAELDASIDQIVAAVELDKDVSEVCLLPIKASDLYSMGLGKDANQMTTRPQDCFRDTANRISVIFNDIGCWPESPGGVSNCRRDLVNGHSTIRNHVLAESANEYGIPRFQIEKNVQSLKILPLWGLDRKTPNHGVIDNLLQSEVDEKISNTAVRRDIVGTFVPLLKMFVHGARSKRVSRKDLIKYSNVMLTMFKYFEHKDYNDTWNSKEVASAWIEAWLTPYNDPNIMEFSESFELEHPSMSDFRDALNIYISYFFIFSVQTPEDCPKVFQSTHHGISSLFGMLLKYRRGATFGIWDHAILWRECCLNISPAQCQLPVPVQSMLLAGIGLATRLAYFHADVVLPCTPFFNPIWEAEIGTDRGRLGSKKQFTRKIDPIVNGVSNMDSFKPVEQVRSEVPTVVMLSNVQFIKDIKTALLSADIIVNKFGFKDYRLMVYGSKDREPSYAIDMGKLIAQYKLSDNVTLAGFGNPQEVLKDAWLFMNSSLSEGLPLAIAEAALAGVPIVATAVGATALVLTDPDDQEQKYGEVVPPNDPMALARAQISMLAMAGPWSKFTGEVGKRQSVPPSLTVPEVLGEHDVEWLTRRMYEKADDRRKLGMLSRQTVLRGFHGKRYLREHEQMYWIQWHLARMRKTPELAKSPGSLLCFGAQIPLRYAEETSEQTAHGFPPYVLEKDDRSHTVQQSKESRDTRWQDFPSNAYTGKRLSKQRVEERSISLVSTV